MTSQGTDDILSRESGRGEGEEPCVSNLNIPLKLIHANKSLDMEMEADGRIFLIYFVSFINYIPTSSIDIFLSCAFLD